MARRNLVVLRQLDRGALPARRRSRLDRFALGLATGILIGGVLFAFGVVKADEGDDAPRFSPASRGPRASYATDQVQQWRPAVEAYEWPTETALRVIACESEGDAAAVNPWSGAAGLFQLYRWSRLAERLTGLSDVLVGWVNIRTAYALWSESESFSWHWAASRGCWA
jgi:hypothetical protein